MMDRWGLIYLCCTPLVACTGPGEARAESPVHVPDWVADAVFYQIFPERFANGDRANDPTRESLEDTVPPSWGVSRWTGDWYARADWEREIGDNFFEHGVFHRRYGGDLQGIIDRLDYLQNLGVTAIYLNPVFHARSLHKYDGSSFHHVDPHFGPDPAGDLAAMEKETSDPKTWQWTTADRLFLKLLEQAHARGLRVIIDGVFNHTGRDFFAFKNLREQQAASPYASWYTVERFDDPATPASEFKYKCWWGVDTLPEFADTADGKNLHAGPAAYVLDITQRWMDPDGDGDPADGIDGWRLDVAREVPVAFWRDWHALVQSINPEAYTVAEEWDEASKFLGESAFDATMNYFGFSFPTKGYLIDSSMPAAKAAAEFHDRLASMIINGGRRPYEKADRFDYDISVSPRSRADYELRMPDARERRIQRMVALLQMTYLGAPMVYYGTEAGMWGADDPCDRMPMVWPDMSFEPQAADPRGRVRSPQPVAFDQAMFEFYRAAIALRKRFLALRRGEIEFLPADDAAKFLAFRRSDGPEDLLVGLNRGDAVYQWRVPTPQGATVSQLFTASGEIDKVVLAPPEGDVTLVTLPPLEAVVLRVSRPE